MFCSKLPECIQQFAPHIAVVDCAKLIQQQLITLTPSIVIFDFLGVTRAYESPEC